MRSAIFAGFALAAMLAAGTPSAAQEPPGPPTQIGLQIGFSRAGFRATASELQETRQGALFGVFVDHRIAGYFSTQVELFLAKKGGGLSTVTDGTPVSLGVQLVYIEVPVLARLRIPVGTSQLHPTLFGGGALAFNIGCDLEAEVPGQILLTECGADQGVDTRAVDLGAVVGGGVEYAWSTSRARIELRRNVGLRTVLPGDPAKNDVWAILFGLTL